MFTARPLNVVQFLTRRAQYLALGLRYISTKFRREWNKTQPQCVVDYRKDDIKSIVLTGMAFLGNFWRIDPPNPKNTLENKLPP
jgi:hypothetical protein